MNKSTEISVSSKFLLEILDCLAYPFKHLDSDGLDDAEYLFEVLIGHLDTINEEPTEG